MTTSDDQSGGILAQPRLTRREACSLGVGLSAGATLGMNPWPAFAAPLPAIRYVITDRRHAESLAFGAVLSGHGAQRLETTEGLTRLWRDALLPLWQADGGAIAGVTPQGICAAIAEQARSWGRRLILVGHHSLGDDGRAATHLVRAPRAVLNAAPALARCGGAWPQMMACLVMQRPAGAAREMSGRPYQSPATPASPPARSLVSWIIE